MSGFKTKFDYERRIEGAVVADYECCAWIDVTRDGWGPLNIQLRGLKNGAWVWVDAPPDIEREIKEYLVNEGVEMICERLDDCGVNHSSYANEHRLTAHELGVGS